MLTPEQIRRALSLAEAAALLRGRGGKRPSLCTVRRWANPRRGCKVPGRPEPVILTTVRCGQDVLTLPEWVEAFSRARVSSRPAQPPAVERPPLARSVAARAAAARLDRAGIK